MSVTDDRSDPDIAIVGMAGRFPDAPDIEAFWRNLREGRNAVRHFSLDELRAAGVDEALLADPAYVKAGVVLEGADQFDASLFGFTPREAEMMDPQHRLLLETAWTALENAGCAPERFNGAIGVFASCGFATYFLQNVLTNRPQVELFGMLPAAIGNETDSVASMLSYKLNLRGPSLAVQTFCSSSLVAVHLACQSLLSGESDITLAAGAAVSLPQGTGYLYKPGGILSPDACCRTFDARAAGSVYGSGVGVLVLKRLEDALEQRDHVYAVIKGSAVNNDGAVKVGYTAPGVQGQAAVISEAMGSANVDPDTIDYVEAHGTATPLGDSIELAALAKAFRSSTVRGRTALGSVKTNIGHLDRAAGVTGVIKMALALAHGEMPPSLHFETPNPDIDFDRTPFFVNTTRRDWPRNGHPRRAGVSSFGLGGTNAHVVLEEAPEPDASGPSRSRQLLLLSAKTTSALDGTTAALAEHLAAADVNLADAAWTLQTGRGRFSARRMLVCRDRADAAAALGALDPARVATAWTDARRRPVSFLFPGVGDHYVQMASELYRTERPFREAMDRCAVAAAPHLDGRDLRAVLWPADASAAPRAPKLDLRKMLAGEGTAGLDEPRLAQTAVFAVSYALAQTLIAWGLQPDALIGYSLGEYTAACVAGVFAVEDAIAIVARRAAAIEALPPGAMLAVALGAAQMTPWLRDGLSLGVINGPAMSVVSGPVDAIADLERALAEQGLFCRRVKTTHALHTPHMAAAAAELQRLVAAVPRQAPKLRFISNVTGTWITPEEATSPAYWARHLCETVRFDQGLDTLLAQGDSALVEVGPGQTLGSLALQRLGTASARPVAATLRNALTDASDIEFLLSTIGRLWLAGVEPDWNAFSRDERRARVPLPGYAFERSRYWIEPGDQPYFGGKTRTAPSAGKKPDVADWFYAPAWVDAPLADSDRAAASSVAPRVLLFADTAGVGVSGAADVVAGAASGVQAVEATRATSEASATTTSAAGAASATTATSVANAGDAGNAGATGPSLLVAAIERELAAAGAGASVVRVARGTTFVRHGAAAFTIDPVDPDHYRQLLRDLLASGPAPAIVLHAWNLAAAAPEGDVPAMTRAFREVTLLARALGEECPGAAVRLQVLASGLHARDGGSASPARAVLLGPCMVIPQEYPQIACRTIDVGFLADAAAGGAADAATNATGSLAGNLAADPAGGTGHAVGAAGVGRSAGATASGTPAAPASLAAALVADALSTATDANTMYRDGVRLVQTFRPAPLAAVAEADDRLKTRGVYLITGGLGGVGLVLARFLAERYQARLVLTARTALPARDAWTAWLESHPAEDATSARIQRLLALEAAGAELLICAADAADAGAMADAMAQADARFGRLDGVIHAAGLTTAADYAPLQAMRLADVERQFRPKILGALVLQQLLRDRDVDFCLLFSSLSAVLGGITLSAYASANAFLSAFAAAAQTGRTRWTAVDWDTWKVREQEIQDEKYRGLTTTVAQFSMTPAEGADAFHRALCAGRARLVHSTADLGARLDQWIRRTALRAARDAAADGGGTLYARPQLQTPYQAVSNETEKRVAQVWQRVLGIDKVGIHDNYFDLGGNSLLALQVTAELQRELGVPVSPLQIFESPTVSALARVFGGGDRDRPAEALQARIDRRRRLAAGGASRDIAVIGMAGRFPRARSVAELWRNLHDGVDCVSTLTDDELRAAGVEESLLRDPRYVKARPVLDDIDLFDAEFFGYSPKDADLMDPQHRLLLEGAWETLEDAGYDPSRYPGSVGVFVGSNYDGYFFRLIADPEIRPTLNLFEAGLVNDRDSLATKLSYRFNLRGPSLAVQTFCSTSLVAVHLAMQSVRNGECDMAIAGGVSIKIPQKTGHLSIDGGQESPDGRTRTFDKRAKGTAFGDGMGLVLLKRLEDAIADGDCIQAVIKGSAINNDGSAKVSYTAPSVDGQAAVIAMALADADVDAASLQYVEAHGTATELGDPIEVAALTKAFRRTVAGTQVCALGSVKSNVGHLDRAAGATGLIKVVLSLQHRQIPASLHFEAPNPKMDLEHSPFYVNDRLSDWRTTGGPRRAGVSSLGVGGTNAHVVVEEAPAPSASGASRPWQLLTWSARRAGPLAAIGAALADRLAAAPELPLADVAFTLHVGRRPFAHRRAVVCRGTEDAIAHLRAGTAAQGIADPSRSPSVALWFSDAAPGVDRELYDTEPLLRAEIDRGLDAARSALGSSDVTLDRLLAAPRESESEQAAHRSPVSGTAAVVSFVQQHALARLLTVCGVRPMGVAGEGVGLLVADCLADRLSLEEAIAIAALPPDERAARHAVRLDASSSVAPCIPVFSSVEALRAAAARVLVVGCGASALGGMDAGIQAANAAANAVGKTVASNAAASTATNVAASTSVDLLLLAPTGAGADADTGADAGAGVNLSASATATANTSHLATADDGSPSASLLRALGTLWTQGVEIDWDAYHADERRLRVPLPTYPFERSRHWIEPRAKTPAVRAPEPDRKAARWAKEPLDEWFYAPVWKQSPQRLPRPAADDRPSAPRCWLLLDDGARVMADLAAEIASRGDDWMLVAPGAEFRARGERHCTIDPARAAHYTELIAYLRGQGRIVTHVLHGWTLDAVPASAAASVASPPQPLTSHDMADATSAHHAHGSNGHGHVAVDGTGNGNGNGNRSGDSSRIGAGIDGVGVGSSSGAGVHPSGGIGEPIAAFDDDGTRESEADVDRTLERGLYAIVHLVQALGADGAHPVQIGILADGIYRVHGTETIRPSRATLVGPCRAVTQEYPHIDCRLIELQSGGADPRALARRLVAELQQASGPAVVAYRGLQRWLPAPERMTLTAAGSAEAGAPIALRERGVYLITGGMGGVGLAIAQHLARSVRARLVLVGRSGLPVSRDERVRWLREHGDDAGTAARIQQIEALEALGAEVRCHAADVADAARLRTLLDDVEQAFGEIHGVIHAAGTAAGELIAEKTAGSMRAVLRAKIDGTRALDAALAGRRIDFLLLMSSLSSWTGTGLGQVDYCAANAFLDAFARRRDRDDRRVLAVNWCEWTWNAHDRELGGLDAHVYALMRDYRRAMGITADEGGAALDRVLGAGLSELIVSTQTLDRLERPRASMSIASRSAAAAGAGAGGTAAAGSSACGAGQAAGGAMTAHPRPELETPYVAPSNDVEAGVAAIWCEMLGIDPVGVQDDFFDLGGHSLLATQVFARIGQRFDVNMSVGDIFDVPTVSTQAEMIAALLWARRAADGPGAAETAQEAVTGEI